MPVGLPRTDCNHERTPDRLGRMICLTCRSESRRAKPSKYRTTVCSKKLHPMSGDNLGVSHSGGREHRYCKACRKNANRRLKNRTEVREKVLQPTFDNPYAELLAVERAAYLERQAQKMLACGFNVDHRVSFGRHAIRREEAA